MRNISHSNKLLQGPTYSNVGASAEPSASPPLTPMAHLISRAVVRLYLEQQDASGAYIPPVPPWWITYAIVTGIWAFGVACGAIAAYFI